MSLSTGWKARSAGPGQIVAIGAILVLLLCVCPVVSQENPFNPGVPGGFGPDETEVPTVPDLMDEPFETATWRLRELDLERHVMEGPAHDPGAVVVGQDPPGGADLPRDRIVRLWLAAERRFIEVPLVIGELVGDAERIIAERGLRPEVVGGEAPADARAIRQEPEPGVQTEPGHPVWVWVEDWVTVPDLVGLPVRQATRELRIHGLRIELAREDFGRDDEIVFQEPKAGARVAPGSIVFLDVRTSAALVRVPAVIDLEWEAALLEIEEARLAPQVSPTSEHDHGRVIRQQPVGGARARPGDPVLLWLLARPRPECGPPCVVVIVVASIAIVGLGAWLWLRGSGGTEPDRPKEKHRPASLVIEEHLGEPRSRIEGSLQIGAEIRLEPVPDVEGCQTLDVPGALVTGWEELP